MKVWITLCYNRRAGEAPYTTVQDALTLECEITDPKILRAFERELGGRAPIVAPDTVLVNFHNANGGAVYLPPESTTRYVPFQPRPPLTAREIKDFMLYLRACTNYQVVGVYEKEHAAQRYDFAELARIEAENRGIDDRLEQ